LRRARVTADFHCVTGWSAREVRWSGVPFRRFYETVIRPHIPADVRVSHLLVIGADGWKADVLLEDALGPDVLLADRLDGVPIRENHGAPLRFVSPGQYGYKNVKHLVRIELYDHDPNDLPGPLGPRLALLSLRTHPRARVALEERHRYLPAKLLRWPYRNVAYPLVVGLLSLQQALFRSPTIREARSNGGIDDEATG
jgi:DMSO/TMAO reductase YedYZ molybdopterin-dependent catalytic subunit